MSMYKITRRTILGGEEDIMTFDSIYVAEKYLFDIKEELTEHYKEATVSYTRGKLLDIIVGHELIEYRVWEL